MSTNEEQLTHDVAGLGEPTAVPPPDVKTIVSTDVVAAPTAVANGVVLIPMAEWKQCAQRGVRSGIQCATFLLGGGSLALFAAQFGIAPDMLATLPTTGSALIDAVLVSVVFGLLCFLWNFIEFWLDIDIAFPKWRA